MVRLKNAIENAEFCPPYKSRPKKKKKTQKLAPAHACACCAPDCSSHVRAYVAVTSLSCFTRPFRSALLPFSFLFALLFSSSLPLSSFLSFSFPFPFSLPLSIRDGSVGEGAELELRSHPAAETAQRYDSSRRRAESRRDIGPRVTASAQEHAHAAFHSFIPFDGA